MRNYALALAGLAALLAAFWFGRQAASPQARAGEHSVAGDGRTSGPSQSALSGDIDAPAAASGALSSSAGEADAPALQESARGQSSASVNVDQWLITDGMLNEQSLRIMETDGFSRFVARAKGIADSNSVKATSGYRAIVEAGLVDQPGSPQVSELVCTNRLCLASIVGDGSATDSAAWTKNIQQSASGTDWRISTMAQVDRPLADGRTETRLIFTTGSQPGGFIQRGPAR